MDPSRLYHAGTRHLQDAFDGRRIADRLEAVTLRQEFSAGDRAFIEAAGFFFLATADAASRPDCSFTGGMPGFVRVTGPDEPAFPDHDGNGMFKSLGNILVNPEVGLLFIARGERTARLRVNGTATVARDDPLIGSFTGAQLLVWVQARAIFPNGPRYIPGPDGLSPYTPRPGEPPVEPAWKSFPEFEDAVPKRAGTPGAAEPWAARRRSPGRTIRPQAGPVQARRQAARGLRPGFDPPHGGRGLRGRQGRWRRARLPRAMVHG